jgi:hypothetical protein
MGKKEKGGRKEGWVERKDGWRERKEQWK